MWKKTIDLKHFARIKTLNFTQQESKHHQQFFKHLVHGLCHACITQCTSTLITRHNQNITFHHIHSTYYTMWAIFSLHTITMTKLHTTIIKTLSTIFQTPLGVFQIFCSLPMPHSHHTTHFHVNDSQCNQNTMFYQIHSTCFIMWAIFVIFSQHLALQHFFQSCSHMLSLLTQMPCPLPLLSTMFICSSPQIQKL